MKKQLKHYFKFLVLLFGALAFLLNCEKEEIIHEPINEQSSTQPFQNKFDATAINKELRLGENNFQVDWNTSQIITFDKKNMTTIYEYDAFLTNEILNTSKPFVKEITYKLLVTKNNYKNTSYKVLRFEPFMASNNLKPSSLNLANFDGMKFVLDNYGKIEDILTYKEGIEIASFKTNVLDKQEINTTATSSKTAPPVACDPTSFYYNARTCAEQGGTGSGGYVTETTYNYVDWYKRDPNGTYLHTNGFYYSYSSTHYTGSSSRWVWVEGGNYINYVFESDGPHTGDFPDYVGTYRLINNLTGLAKCVFKKLLTQNGNLFKSTIGEFIDNPDYNLQLNSGGTCNTGEDACTDGSNIDEGLAIINIVNEGRGTLDLAALILHEGIHAEIYKYVNERNNGVDPQDRPNLLEYYFQYKNINIGTAQHQHMADKFVKPIAKAIRALDNDRYPLEDYMGFGWDGLRQYGWDGYYDNGVWKDLERSVSTAYYKTQEKVLDNTNFNNDCSQ